MRNTYLLGACIDAERQYNRCLNWLKDQNYVGLSPTELDEEDRLYNGMRRVYSQTMHFLHQQGVGGVLINGYFRTTEQDREG